MNNTPNLARLISTLPAEQQAQIVSALDEIRSHRGLHLLEQALHESVEKSKTDNQQPAFASKMDPAEVRAQEIENLLLRQQDRLEDFFRTHRHTIAGEIRDMTNRAAATHAKLLRRVTIGIIIMLLTGALIAGIGTVLLAKRPAHIESKTPIARSL